MENILFMGFFESLDAEVITRVSLKILRTVALAWFAKLIGGYLINKFFVIKKKGRMHDERRDLTIKVLLKNVLFYVVSFFAIVNILSILNVDVKTILAGAGVVGIAVGFGAQSLVKDMITGFFIILEDQFSVGDFVRINNYEGTVTQIGLRITTLRAITGEVHIIPNGNILDATNFSVENSIAIIDISIAYEEDLEVTEQVIKDLLLDLPGKYPDIIGEPQFLGIQNLGASGVVYRITCETLPMKHFQIQRQIKRDIKNTLDEHGIEIPYPKMVYYEKRLDKNNQ